MHPPFAKNSLGAKYTALDKHPRSAPLTFASEAENVKQIRILNESLGSIWVALQAMVGTAIGIGILAILLRITTGKW
jgi:hypothetical protein